MISPSRPVPVHNDPLSELVGPMRLHSWIECHMSCGEVSMYRFMPIEDNLLVPVGINDNSINTYLHVILLKFRMGESIGWEIQFRIQRVPTQHTFGGPRSMKMRNT